MCTIHTKYNGERMRSREVIELMEADGWKLTGIRGSHHYFKHPSKPGKVVVPHPKVQLPIGTLNSILKTAGLK
ncbi:type II toxin-antitoxin system HicA family toxin [Pseudomonas sp. RP23018S]|uniref:type II toxin-antitoxin system HicA family toxin n=1 Tax=Pseudomonas sp. RP23018S TaxID=3096037 RepID=UPI002ACA1A54|nr:type II toxin-antitoxin system HicA family toxin [Pseudomonas sp. RP23018S]MDZ5604021.1 type II toxin-antitoxin system HicA family toxin [Pseudomonas sp. RP23018S]